MTQSGDNSEQVGRDRARALSNWYKRALRGFLIEHAPTQVAQLDDDHSRLERSLAQEQETVVCFVGESGIGKSTLLNALVAQEQTIVPSGGVGPLTALAVEARYNSVPRFIAEYHPKQHLWRLASALNFQVNRSQKKAAPSAILNEEVPDNSAATTEEDVLASDPENEGATTRMDEIIRTARLLVAGNQSLERSVEYLADALSQACSVAPRWGTQLEQEDAARIDRIRLALQMSERAEGSTHDQSIDVRAFRSDLREHAAGYLAPLVRRMEVGWPSELLQTGLVLVDLPGVGVAGDVYKKETQRFVRERARAIVLVVGRAGLTESIIGLLRLTGYWDRLLLSADDAKADPCALILVVTHVDEVASEEWRNLEVDDNNKRPKSKAQVFTELRDRLKETLKGQFEQQLGQFTQTESSEAIRVGRESAARNILNSLQVHPISAVQYRQLLSNDGEDLPFLNSVDQTGLPELYRSLLLQADAQREKRTAQLQALTRRLAESLSTQLGAIESTWLSDRAAEEAERIRAVLDVVLKEKSSEYEKRRSSFRTFLKQTVPEKVKVAVLEAKDEARKDINRYLRDFQDAHWATLRAAVQRGGTFHGARYINFPSDIALRFQDPVAAVWNQSLIKDIRQETYTLARDIRQLVEEICDYVSSKEEITVDQNVIQAQKKMVSGQVERLRDVGKEVIEELKEAVKVRVVNAIERPIRDACRQFVEEGKNAGPGVKRRILELFAELAGNATEGASAPTRKALLSRYEAVEAEIRKAFEDWEEPLETATNAIAERHEDRARRSDSQKRKRVLTAIQEFRAEAPWLRELTDPSSGHSRQPNGRNDR